MNKNTQANAKKEERRARRLARKLLISYVVQNPGAIRTIKENDTIFNSVSDFTDFILDEDNPKNLRFAQRTASFVEKNSDDLKQLSDLLREHPDALGNTRISPEMLQWFSTPHEEMNNFKIVGKLAQNVLGDQEVIESLACVSYFVTEEDTVSSFSSYLESHPDVPPLVATIRFIKENPAKAQTFMEFIEQDSIDIARIANFLRVPENEELSSALGLPKEGQKVVNFLADNSEQIQPAVSMIQNNISKPELLDILNTAENFALFMDKEENKIALNNISDYLSKHESELNSYEGIAKFIENCPQDLHKFSELCGKNKDGIVTLAQIFQDRNNAQYAKMFNLNDEEISTISKTIVENKDMLQAIALSANNLLNDENSAVRSSLSEIATFMSNRENEGLIKDFSKYMQIKKREGMSEPLAFIKYVKDNPENVSNFLGFVADKNDDISNIISFTQTDENIKLAETLGLNSDVTEIFSVLHENADKIEPAALLIKDKILDSDQRDELLDSLSSITEFCTQQENIELFKQIQSGKYNFSSVEGVTSFIDQNYNGAQNFIRFIGNNGEKIINLSQFVESNSDYIDAIMGSDAEVIKNITSYMNKNPENFKKAAQLASRVFDFDAEHKNVRKTIINFITDENNKKSIQKISETLSNLQANGIQPFSLDGIEQLIDTNHKDLNNVLSFIENNHKDLVTLGAFLKENINYAPVFGLKDAESIKSFLETLQENPEKIQPAAKFTKNLIAFYVEHPDCKKITKFYKQDDNAEQISALIKKMGNINLDNPNDINSILDNQNDKKLLQQTAKLISKSSKDIVAFAGFLSNEENTKLLEKLTKGIDGAENAVKSAQDILQFINKEQKKLKPAANILCTALEFDSKHPGIRKSLLDLYKKNGSGIKNFINDCNVKKPSDACEWIDLIHKHRDSVTKVANWLERYEDSRKDIGWLIKNNKDDMAKVFGMSPSDLNKIADYMVDTPWWMEFIINNPNFSIHATKALKDAVINNTQNINPWSPYCKNDIKKTDNLNKPLLATMKQDTQLAKEKSQNFVTNEFTTADIMKRDTQHAQEIAQNIGQSFEKSSNESSNESSKETQKISLYAYKKENLHA